MFHTWPVKISRIAPSSTPNWRVGNSETIASITPAMARAKSNGLLFYGELAARYDRAFEHKWIDGVAVATPLLGSADIQSLADMGNSFELVRSMRITPFGQAAVVKLLLATALPVLPLLLLAVPLNQIFRDLTKMMF